LFFNNYNKITSLLFILKKRRKVNKRKETGNLIMKY